MKLDIRTTLAEPRRQTYAHLARRFGEDRVATRYEEAVMDLQPTANFHYRPLAEPERELFDVRRTGVVMSDWYKLLDPRQLYYATYTISRAAMEAANARSFELAEKQGMFAELTAAARAQVVTGILPMRHFEWGANLVNWSICDRGYGAAVTSAAAFVAMDRLGLAQVISKIGLAIDDQTGTSLADGKKAWLEAPAWQGIRRATENVLVVEDWFEALVAQDLVLDGIVYRLVFEELRKAMKSSVGLVLVTEMPAELHADNARWVDAVIKVAAAESPENEAKIAGWFARWRERAVEAARPLASELFGKDGDAIVTRLASELSTRAAKIGIAEVAS